MRVKDLYETKTTSYDPYVYPNTNILINNQNIINQEDLNKFERLNVSLKLVDLHLYEVEALDAYILFDINHLKNIHEYLFEDLYPFAGIFRNVDIVKGNTMFCKAMYVEKKLKELLLCMKKDMLTVKNRNQYLDRIAFYYAELNLIHPFREGNGRTIREFLREYVSLLNHLLDFVDYELNYSYMTSETLLDATIYSVNNDHSKLIEEFDKAICEREIQKKVRK